VSGGLKLRPLALALWLPLWLLFPAATWAAALPEDAQCIESAALRHRLPPSLIRAILAVEGGRHGQVSHNRNGSYDIGPMQINSLWLPEIERRGGSLALILHHRCANIEFGAWLLGRELAGADPATLDRATFWRAVGNYHSRTPALNRAYAERVWRAWRKSAPAGRQ
jgi:hypothetical protein